MPHKPVVQRLDDLSRASGLYGLTMIDRPRPRNLRWLPVLILAAMTVGCALLQTDSWLGSRPLTVHAIAGSLLLFGGFLAANFVRFFGPRMVPDQRHHLDERERLIKAQAGSMSGWILIVIVVGGCLWFAATEPFPLWRPHLPSDWINLAVALQGWALTLPVLIASWLQAPDLDEED